MAGFLKQLFSAKWQHKDPEVRLGAIDPSLDQETLKTLAGSDPDPRVRQAAIQHIQSQADLIDLYQKNASQTEIASAAFNQIKQGIASDDLSGVDIDLLSLLAGQNFDPELAQSAITNIGDEQKLFELIQVSPSAKARHLAIENIHDIELLKSIEKAFKSKDKTLVRIAKDKIQVQQEELEQQKSIQLEIQQLLQQAKQLAEQAFDPLFAGKLNLLKQEWDQLPEQKNAREPEFLQAIEKCNEILRQNEKIQTQLNEQAAQQQKTVEKLNHIIEEGNFLYEEAKAGRFPSERALNELNQSINEAIVIADKQQLNEKERELKSLYKALLNLEQSLALLQKIKDISIDKENATVGDLKKALSNIGSTLKKVNWPSEFPTPTKVKELDIKQNAIKDELQIRKEKEASTLKQVRKELASMESALEDGQAKLAEQSQKQLKNLFSLIDVQQNKNLYGQFKALQKTLFDLNDWKGFASAPKLEALCEKMQALADNPLDGKTQLEQIQILQEEWKAVSKASTQAQQKHYWPRFKQAKDTAFNVCNTYFAQQAEQKQANKEAREEICSQLEQFLEQNDWQHCDFKAVVELIAKARQEYKRFAPVEQADHKALQERFYNAVKAIEAKVDEHYQSIADEKQTLINQVGDLLAHDDLAEAIDKCKHIQERWKQTGNAGRKENSLWKAFRAECDKLFDRRKQANEEHKQAIQAEISEANALIDGLSQEVHEGRGHLNGLQQTRQDIRNLNIPNKVRAGIEGKLDKLADTIKQQQRMQKQAELFSQWQQLADLAEQLASNKPISEQALDEAVFDKPLQPVKDAAMQAINLQQSLTEQEQQALCIELDITLGVESPTEEQELRMAAQVKRLQASIGQGASNPQEQMIDLAKQWMSSIPEQDSQYRKRFWLTLLNAVEPKTKNAPAALID